MAKHISIYDGKQLDASIAHFLKQEEIGSDKILESSVEKPVDLNNLINSEGTFTIEYFEGAGEGTESGKPIEVDVFKDANGATVQRYEQNGTTLERKYDAETEEWTTWKPVQDFAVVTSDTVLDVAKDTIVYHVVKDASEVTPIEEEEVTP